MKELIIILLVIIALVIIYKIIKHWLKNKIEVITAYTGGLGSGKTFFTVDTGLALYRKNLKKYNRKLFMHDLKNKFRKLQKKSPIQWLYECPIILSNIPIIIGYKKIKVSKFRYKKMPIYCAELTKEHLLLQEHIPEGSVVIIDEIGSFASQFDYNQKNVIEVFDEFVRFFRHYVSNPKLKIQSYMVVNDQCSENINLVIRRRLNIINNLSNFYLLFGHFIFWYERKITISEEIKTIDLKQEETEADTQDNMNIKFKLYFGGKRYDSYCYHDRYNRVPKKNIKYFIDLKKLDVLKCPRDKVKTYSQMTENRTKGGDIR